MSSVKIHGGVNFVGNNGSVVNMELEEKPTDPTIAEKSSLWFSSDTSRVSYAESANPLVIRQVAHLGDIATLQTAINNIPNVNPGVRWRELKGNIRPLKSGGTGNPTLAAFYNGVEAYYHSVGNGGNVCFQIDDDYVLGSDIFIHLHWGHHKTTCSGTFEVIYEVTYGDTVANTAFTVPKMIAHTITGLNITNTPRYSHRSNDEIRLSSPGAVNGLINSSLLKPGGLIMINYSVTAVPSLGGSGTINKPFIFSIDVNHQVA